MRSNPLCLCGFVAVLLLSAASLRAAESDDGFVAIFDGKTLDGWHVSSQTGHGSGGRWMVEDGAIVGSQDKPGNGGIIITDKSYGNFEVIVEMNIAGSTVRSSCIGPTGKSVIRTEAVLRCRSTAAATSPNNSYAIARSA